VHLAVGSESFCSLQQRREIMLYFRNLVNSFFSLRLRFLCRPCSRNHLITLTFSGSAEAEANYNKPRVDCTSPLQKYSSKRVFMIQKQQDATYDMGVLHEWRGTAKA
jgi:hypothetical protein